MTPAPAGPSPAAPSVLWFRRDLRLDDHPALAAAAGGPVVPLFVLDPALLAPAGPPRVAYLLRTLRALDGALRALGGRLVVRSGPPERAVPAVVAECSAGAVHVTRDHGPYGRARDRRVAAALGSVPLVGTGSPYAVPPGAVRTAGGDAFRVFSAFYRAWSGRGWPLPVHAELAGVAWRALPSEDLPPEPHTAAVLPAAGEEAARDAWRAYRRRALAAYGRDRDRPDLDATTRLSPHLKLGTVHPRTLLAGLGPDDEVLRRELAWREFYGAVLAAWPASARRSFQPRLDGLRWASGPEAERHWAAWTAGRTGYPFVDAGMRQLLAEGWMHNRVRMVAASFLVKDLHLDWRRGARHFMRLLVDGDLASNQHGWQWTAGTGTDAAPYHRILNPMTQGRRFDPDGDYVRRWVPELAGVPGPAVHEPWRLPGGPPGGYPDPVVDHAEERARALDDFRALPRPGGA